ncbi:hypothetical protein [Rugamonas sp.]|uniref:hypothetical protein n=1 Tax=Rugamonas sp. TaxID=1926287 RepID=UPI0025EA3E4B|nr:hypothetical protein [Rugamonas sp.]
MNRFRLLLLAVAGAPMVIYAQPVRVSTAVTDASAAVPPPKYQSAFADYKPSVDSPVSPDKLWIQANQEVSGEPEHGAHGGSSMQMTPTPSDSAKPASAPVVDPHKGHDMKKKGQ